MARELFDQITVDFPKRFESYIDYARALAGVCEFRKAGRLLSQATRTTGFSANEAFLVGQTYRMMRRNSRALQHFANTLAANPVHLGACLETAVLHEKQNNLEMAFEFAEKCLKLDRDCAEATILKARILSRLDDSLKAIQLLNGLVKRKNIHIETFSRAWHLLGNLHDQRNDFEAAFHAVKFGKSVLKQIRGPYLAQRAKEMRDIDRIWKRLEKIPANAPPALQSESFVLLTGPPRSGTTLMLVKLIEHVNANGLDEYPTLFNHIIPKALQRLDPALSGTELLHSLNEQDLSMLRQEYLDLSQEISGEENRFDFVIDKNPGTEMFLPVVRHLFPAGKVIFAKRDPKDVFLSMFFCFLPLNSISVNYLTPQLLAEELCKELEYGERFRELVDGSDCFELSYEELVCRPDETLAKVLNFLNRKETSIPVHQERHVQVNSPTYAEVQKPIHQHSIGKWKNYSEFFQSEYEWLDF